MTVTMYDSVNPDAIPSDAALVASYVDGFGGYDAAVAKFGASKVVSITVSGKDADVADVEPGAMTAGQLPAWIAAQKARGVARPGVYCSESLWSSVKAAVGDADVSYWIADWTGSPFALAGADAVQYANGASYDLSLVQDTFPWYPGAVTPPTPPAPPVGPKLPAKQIGTVHSETTGGNAVVYSVDGGQTWLFHKPAGF
jgi:hypothetical protein